MWRLAWYNGSRKCIKSLFAKAYFKSQLRKKYKHVCHTVTLTVRIVVRVASLAAAVLCTGLIAFPRHDILTIVGFVPVGACLNGEKNVSCFVKWRFGTFAKGIGPYRPAHPAQADIDQCLLLLVIFLYAVGRPL